MAIIARIKDSDIVKQSNKVTQANSDYSLLEEKAFTMIFSKLSQFHGEFPPLTFAYSEVCVALETDKKRLRPALRRLQTKMIEIGNFSDETKPWESYAPISKIEDSPNTQTVTLILNNELKPFFLGCAEEYTIIEANKTYRLHSAYSIRIFKMVMQWRSQIEKRHTGFPVPLNYDELRERFKIGDKYKRANDFRDKLLIPAIEDINRSNVGIFIRLASPRKVGRNIIEFVLMVEASKIAASKKASSDTSDKKNWKGKSEAEQLDFLIETHQEEFKQLVKSYNSEQTLDGFPSDITGKSKMERMKENHLKAAKVLEKKYGRPAKDKE